MRYTGLLLLLSCLTSGCGTRNDYLVHYEMKAPFVPDDPNQILTELESELPADVEIKHSFWRQKPEAVRGIVLVASRKDGRAVVDAVRRNPRLATVAGQPQEAYAGEYMICIVSQPPFEPHSDTEVIDELRRGLPSGIKIAINGSRRTEDEQVVVWATVWGNFGKGGGQVRRPSQREPESPPSRRLHAFHTLSLPNACRSRRSPVTDAL